MSAHGKRFEDYLKVVYMLQQRGEEVRLKEVARVMGLKPPTVLQYINKLSEMGLVSYSQGKIRLTEEGKRRAEEIAKKYEVIKRFFCDVLGLSEDKAAEIACLIEHIMDWEAINKLEHIREKVIKCLEVR